MRALLSLAVLLGLGSAMFSPTALAASSGGAQCALPDDLERQLGVQYPNMHLVGLRDLGPDDRTLFVKEHGDSCPGLSSLDFYGDGKSTLAIDLVSNAPQGKKALLVVARHVNASWLIKHIDTAESSTPVVWSDKPGEYSDVYGNKKIRATRPVIVWCAYESWAILYSWTGTRVSKIWISD